MILKSDDTKLTPALSLPFLSKQSLFRFDGGRRPHSDDRPRPLDDRNLVGTGLSGVSFDVRSLVSPDRGHLRIQITQRVAQLVGIAETTERDAVTGKECKVEPPNLRRTVVTGTIQIPDGAAILMPVTHLPPGKQGGDKVWLLLARPFIWIEAEQKERGEMRVDVVAKFLWSSELPIDERQERKTKRSRRLPNDEDTKQILDAVIKHILTDPAIKDTRDFYGTTKDKTFTLVDAGKFGWPEGFRPAANGFRWVEEFEEDPFVPSRRVLGIRIDKFDLKQKSSGFFNAPIEICLFNAGGSANGGVIGGCSVYYAPKRVGKRWTVECEGLMDP
jgi:hypothetical protein